MPLLLLAARPPGRYLTALVAALLLLLQCGHSATAAASVDVALRRGTVTLLSSRSREDTAAALASSTTATTTTPLSHDVADALPSDVVAAAAGAASAGAAVQSNAHSSSAWGGAAGQQQYLMAWTSASQQQSLARFLRRRGATITGYIPAASGEEGVEGPSQGSWLVLTTDDVVDAAAARLGVLVSEYFSSYKVAPEWDNVLLETFSSPSAAASAASPSSGVATAAESSRSLPGALRERRRLLQLRTTSASFGTLRTLQVDTKASDGTLRATILVSLSKGPSGSDFAAAAVADWPEPLAAALSAARTSLSVFTRVQSQEAVAAALGSRSGTTAAGAAAAKAAASATGGGSACEPDIEMAAEELVSLSACFQDLPAALSWLAVQPHVQWLEPKLATQRSNILTSIMLQTGDLTLTTKADAMANPSAHHPLWSAGLTGRGQIIGIGDTGIDLASCYLNDPRFPDITAPNLTHLLNNVTTFTSTDHRKIAMYHAYQGFGDDDQGHGTHTSGTLAASLLKPGATGADPSQYDIDEVTGMAPEARLAFVDGGKANDTGYVHLPYDLNKLYLSVMYNAGGQISSHSWGSSNTAYLTPSRQFDIFLWNHPYAASFLAAGNAGYVAPVAGSQNTIDMPANCKNAIAVGASVGSPLDNPESLVGQNNTKMAFKSSAANFSILVEANGRGAGPVDSSLEAATIVATPADGCTPLRNAAKAAGKVVLVRRGACFFRTKAENVQAAGAKAMVLVNYEDVWIGYDVSGGNTSITIPVAAMLYSDGQKVIKAIKASKAAQSPLLATFRVLPQSLEDVAYFSSYGPLDDGRIKPDFVAPGTDILSSWVQQDESQCNSTTVYEGTSMATPAAAGSAALVRQYFMDGFYPSGSNITADANPFTPSGMLVKAVLIAGARALTGLRGWTQEPLAPPPSGHQGFGRLDLATSLPLLSSAATPRGWRLQVVDLAYLAQGDTHLYQLTATGAGAISLTVTWYDFPALVMSAKALVNDLDLTVTVVSEHGTNTTVYYPNGGSSADRVNNVEKVYLTDLAAGSTLYIAITGYNIPTAYLSPPVPQKYAFVALGHFDGVLASSKPPPPAPRGKKPPPPPRQNKPPPPPLRPSKPPVPPRKHG